MKIRNVFALLVCLAGPNRSHAAATGDANWPQLRGPGGAGVSANANLPDKWSATENVAWKTDLPGRSWSSPIVWGDRVFLTAVVNLGCLNEDGVCYVFRAGDKFELLHTNKLAGDDMCMATPALVGDRLLIRTAARLYCIRGSLVYR